LDFNKLTVLTVNLKLNENSNHFSDGCQGKV